MKPGDRIEIDGEDCIVHVSRSGKLCYARIVLDDDKDECASLLDILAELEVPNTDNSMEVTEMYNDGQWIPPEGSPFRQLTAIEVADLQAMAMTTTPTFGGEHNATWEQHHPVAREVWEKRGLKPKV